MKKLILFFTALLPAGALNAQTNCADLFMSEYVEGWYNNKALELYNPTNAPVTLDNTYRLVRWSNGSTQSDLDPLYVLPLTGTIASFTTWVIIQDTIPAGQDTMVWPALRAKADWLAPYDFGGSTPGGNVVFWNGDDAISLQKLQVNGTWKDIDVFGEIGVRPLDYQGGTTGAWTDIAPYWRGDGTYLTKDQSLIRKHTVKFGIDRITMNHYGDSITGGYPNSFNAFAEYDSMPANFFDSLGGHWCDCQIQSPTTIADIRAMPIGSTVTVYGVATNGSELGNSIRYLQDATAGIAAYKGGSFSAVLRGDSITVTGVLKLYNQLLELDPVTAFNVIGQGTLPDPVVITPGQLNELYEAELVKMLNVTFASGGGVFVGNTNYNVSANGETCQVRINVASNLVGQIIPAYEVNILGIGSQFSYTDPNAGYQLLLRDQDDIIAGSPIEFTTPLSVSNITTSGFSLSWETNIAGSTELFYGRTPALELGHHVVAGTDIIHAIDLAGLNPSDLVYVHAFSVTSQDTGWSGLKPFITQSVSSGNIKTYFTRQVDTTVATGQRAIQIYRAVDDTCIAYINRSKFTIDVAIYNFMVEGISSIAGALNAASNRGVVVRVVTDAGAYNSAIAELVSGIGKIGRPVTTGVMHNKFMVIDGNSADPYDPVVWTGSCNWTDQNINTDANNVLFIQDASLAKVYTLEFNEMFGSATAVPDPSNAKFGPAKSDNTPHELVIGGKRVEVYFGPSDGLNSQIVSHIATANTDLEIGTMLITRTIISNAIIERAAAGVSSKVVITNRSTSDATVVANLGASLGNHFREYHEQGLLHNKMMVVDQSDALSDPFVWTGSNNWSDAANTSNDENSIVIHDAQISNIFFQEFTERFNLAIPISDHPILDLGPDQSVAAGETVTLDAGQFAVYMWSTGEISQIIQVDSSGFGFGTKTIWCRVTDEYGTQSDTVRITFRHNTIADARALGVGSAVTVTGVVSNGSEFGNSTRYLQDATAGIAAYKGGAFSAVLRGDSISITGVLKNYNQLLEIDPVTAFTVIGTGTLPEPVAITPGQLGEPYESKLLKILNVTFASGGGVFAGNTNYNVSAGGETCQVRVNAASDLVGRFIPTWEVTIVGIGSQFHYTDPNAGYQLLLRDQDDLIGVYVGLKEPVDHGIKIFPNPTEGKIHIENIRDCSVSIYSVSGKLEWIARGTEVDVSGLADGMYFISIADHDGIIVFRGKILKY